MMIADQVNALNRAREVAAVANLIRLAAASHQSAQAAAAAAAAASKAAEHQNNQPSPKIKRDPAEDSRSSSSSRHSTEEEEEEETIRMSSSITGPVVVSSAASVMPVSPVVPQPSKRISFSVDSLLSDVRRTSSSSAQQPQHPQTQAADLSLRSVGNNNNNTSTGSHGGCHTSSDEEDNKSMMDSTEEVDCDVDCDEDDEDVDIEEEEGMSETSDSTPNGKISRPSPTLASAAASMFHHHHPHHPANLMSHHHFQQASLQAMQMRGMVAGTHPNSGASVGGPSPFPGSAVGPASHGWPLPYGLAAAAWAQHASQFVSSKFAFYSILFFSCYVITIKLYGGAYKEMNHLQVQLQLREN
jgi:hypothetical protein